MNWTRSPAFLLAMLPATALAAGFEVPDLGAQASGRAGAFTALADDPTAIAYNPAGLAFQKGANLLLEGSLAWNAVSFRRREGPYTYCKTVNGSEVCTPSVTADSVALSKQPNDGALSNSAGSFPSGFAAASYGFELGGSGLSVALGAYGPPAVGHYKYPSPDYSDANFDPNKGTYGQFSADPRVTAPQRYAQIESRTTIVYPTLSLAYRHSDWIAAGASFQYVFFDATMQQAFFAANQLFFGDLFKNSSHPGCDPNVPQTCGPDRMSDENPAFDAVATLSTRGRPTFTGVLGLMARPLSWLWLGGSVRPGYKVVADGTLKIDLPQIAKRFPTTIDGDQATMEVNMPWQARLGARVQLSDNVDVELDGTYEGWHSVDRFVITPHDITFNTAGLPPQTAEPFIVEKHWVDAWSARLGGQWRLPWTVPLVETAKLRAGLLYQTSAIPLQYTSVDFPSWEHFGESVGVTVGVPAFEVTASFSLVQQPTREVTDSKVTGMASDPQLKPFVVGNGTYNSNYTLAQLGVRSIF